jgi:Porin PorA
MLISSDQPPAAAPPGTRPRGHRARPVLAGLGIFLLTTALLLRFYAAPRLVLAPASIYQNDTLVARDASYFDQGTLTSRRHVTLTYSVTVRGDAAAATPAIAVWDSYTVLADRQRNAVVISTYQRAAFNRRTARLVNCCGASLNDDTRARQSGIGLDWPIGVRRTTYRVFDTNTARPWPAAYAGQADDQGVMTYRFVQHIPVTAVQQMPGIPASLLGLPRSQGSVVATRYFSAEVTYWVDPRTGVLIDQEERGRSVLRGPGGRGELDVAGFNLRMTAASRRQLAAFSDKNAAAISAITVTGPLGLGALGLLLTLAGTVPARRRRPDPDRTGPDRPDPERPEPASWPLDDDYPR